MSTSERDLWAGNNETGAIARELKSPDGGKLFMFLASRAAELQWKTFTDVMAHVAGEPRAEIETMLRKVGASMAWSSAYATSEMPARYFPFFMKIVQTARTVAKEAPEIRPGKHVRKMVVGKAYAAMDPRTRHGYTHLLDQLVK